MVVACFFLLTVKCLQTAILFVPLMLRDPSRSLSWSNRLTGNDQGRAERPSLYVSAREWIGPKLSLRRDTELLLPLHRPGEQDMEAASLLPTLSMLPAMIV